MLCRVGGLLGGGGRGATTLVGPGFLAPAITFARTQASGAMATVLGSDGLTWSEVAANTPRYFGAANRLLIEGQRTNLIRNPRGEGAVAGSPGTLPTYAGVSADSGLTFQVLGAGRSNGIDYVDMRLSGTAGSSSSGYRPEAIYAAVPVVNGQTYTASALITFLAPPVGITGSSLNVAVVDAGSHLLPGHTLSVPMSLTAGVMSRPQIAMPVTNAAAVALRMQIALIHVIGSVVDVSFRIGWPQIEVGTFASTPILPAIGTPAAATRGEDSISATLTSLGIPASGDCTLLWSGVVQAAAPATANETMLHVDSGSNTNRFFLRVVAGSLNVQVGRSNGGATVSSPTIAAMVEGAPFRAGMTISGGRVAGSVNGGAVQEATGGVTSGLTVFRVGTDAAAAAALFGETLTVRLLRGAVSDQQLRALVAAMPV